MLAQAGRHYTWVTVRNATKFSMPQSNETIWIHIGQYAKTFTSEFHIVVFAFYSKHGFAVTIGNGNGLRHHLY